MGKTTAIQTREYSQEEIQVLQQTLAKGTTPAQFQLFLKTAQYAGLNPFLNHIHCIVYGQGQNATMSIQISVEGIVYLAKQHPDYRGYDVQTVHENDVFKARKVRHENGEDSWEIVTHEVCFPRGKVIGAYAIAYREGFRPFVVLMDVEEVQHHLTGRNSHTWKTYFNDMFKKHVLKRAIKGQFGIDIAEDEHIPSVVDTVSEYRPRPDAIDVTSQVKTTASEQPVQTAQPAQPEDKPDDEAATKEMLTAEIKEKFKRLGITNAAGRKEFFDKHGITFANPKEPTVAEMTGLIKVLDMELAKQADDDLLE